MRKEAWGRPGTACLVSAQVLLVNKAVPPTGISQGSAQISWGDESTYCQKQCCGSGSGSDHFSQIQIRTNKGFVTDPTQYCIIRYVEQNCQQFSNTTNKKIL